MRQNGEVLRGQQYDPELDLLIPFTEQEQNYNHGGAAEALGDAKTEVIPTDANASKVRVWDTASISTALAAFSKEYVGVTTVNDLPDVLVSAAVVYSKSHGEGISTQEGFGASAGSSASLTLSLPARSQGSASIVPDLQVVLRRPNGERVASRNFLFYVAGTVTMAAILSRLTTLAGATVLAWPRFAPVTHIVTLRGQQVSVSAEATAQQHVSFSDANQTYTWGAGLGTNKDFGVTVRTYQIPLTIHGAITIGSSSDTDSVTATATSGWPAGGSNWPTLPDPPANGSGNLISTISGTATADVIPTSLATTAGGGALAAIPTSGLYLRELRVDPSFRYGLTRVFAEVINFSDIA